MIIDKKIWQNQIKILSEAFINEHYVEEVDFFGTFYQSFIFQLDKTLETNSPERLILNQASNIVTDISFAKSYALDMSTPVVMATVAETILQITSDDYSCEELQTLVSNASAKFGANPELTACLTRHLPQLYLDIIKSDINSTQAVVSESPESNYRIWVNGEVKITDSIDQYSKNKDKYIFWIDLDKRPEKSKSFPDPKAIELLKYLVKNIGCRNSIESILKEIYKDIPTTDDDTDKNKIEQQLTQLNNYSKKKFRKYLFRKWSKEGLGLEESFKDKYFIFTRLALKN